ncbi:MAG: hypothetical protein Q9187_005326, partial [Circinaria calcarea]
MTDSMSMIPLRISDYHVLPISLPPLSSFPTPATHYLYLRPDEPKIPNHATPRSLFLVNVPFDATVAHIKGLFSKQLELPAGRIEDVQFEYSRRRLASTQDDISAINEASIGKSGKSRKRKRTAEEKSPEELESARLPATWDRELHKSGSTAVAIFVDRVSMEAAIKAVKRARKQQTIVTWGEGLEEKVPSLGSARYLNHHRLRYPDKTEMLESVNSYMTAYAAQEASRARALARQRQEPDEDGFITVTRGGRTGPARQEEAQELAEKQREKQKGLEDFYRFQTREKRKERAGELIKRFEEDKEKIRKMKEKRGRFK